MLEFSETSLDTGHLLLDKAQMLWTHGKETSRWVVAGRQVPIFSYFSQQTPIFPIFFSNFLLFFSHFTYNKQIFVRDLNILSLFKYVVYRVH